MLDQTRAPEERMALTMNSNGVFTLARELRRKEFGRGDDGAHDLREVAAVSRNVPAARSITAAGGSSATNRLASFAE